MDVQDSAVESELGKLRNPRLDLASKPHSREVPLIEIGSEIHSLIAEQIQPISFQETLYDNDLIVYYHGASMSFRYGRVRVPGPGPAFVLGPGTNAIPIQTTNDNVVEIMDLIDIFIYREDSAPNSWIQGQTLGQGAFGLVFEAIDVVTGIRLAVKQVPITVNSNLSGKIDDKIGRLCREVQMLKSLSHTNVVRYIGGRLHPDNHSIYIFMELVASGSLSNLIRNYGPLPESLIQNYIRQIVLGLKYLHENGIVHRDIKSSNILVTTDGVIKLADFGAARQLQDACWTSAEVTSVCGTPGWMAPEVIQHGTWSSSSDIWSLGCVFIEMGSGCRPWPQYNPNQILWMLAETDRIPDIPGNLSDQAQSLIKQCLHRDPRVRPQMKQLLEHPFLDFPKI